MKSVDLWLAGFGLRCAALLALELGSFLYLIPTLFDRHSDLADLAAAGIAILALLLGTLWGLTLAREFRLLVSDHDHD